MTPAQRAKAKNAKNAPSAAIAVEHVAPSVLRPAPYNPRRMDPAERARLERGIKEFGLVDPIIARRSDGLVIGGHQRLVSATNLGLTSVPVIYLDGIDDDRAKALNLLLNNPSAQGEWDMPLLTELLAGLSEIGFDATLTGFDEQALAELLAPAGGILGDVDLDDAPDLPKTPITKLGDLVVLGRHRLVCGDATEASVWDALLDTRQPDMVWTDPPYGVSYVGKTKQALTVENDTLDPVALAAFLRSSLSLAWTHCRAGAAWYVTGPAHAGPGWAFTTVLYELGVFRHSLVWVKDSLVMGRSDYHYRHEPIFYGWKEGASRHAVADRKQDSVWEFARPKVSREHPTMKPVALIQRCIENSSAPSDLVVDPFGGSGSTLIAAEAAGRSAAVIELSPAYCDVIVTRWEAATGQKAVRA